MRQSLPLFLLFFLAGVCLATLVLIERHRGRRALAMCAGLSEQASAAVDTASARLRLLRAAGTELREQALSLLGQSEICAKVEAVEWAAIAARLLAIADDLQDHDPPSPESRVLVRELLIVGPLVAQCVAAVAATLRPGLRMWKLAPGLNELEIYADQRALTQVLLRVLANAARATRHLDWIEVDVEHATGQVILTVQDEGSGLLIPSSCEPDASAGHSRVSGLGLAVARSLAQAHGGNLAVESVPGIGARVAVILRA